MKVVVQSAKIVDLQNASEIEFLDLQKPIAIQVNLMGKAVS